MGQKSRCNWYQICHCHVLILCSKNSLGSGPLLDTPQSHTWTSPRFLSKWVLFPEFREGGLEQETSWRGPHTPPRAWEREVGGKDGFSVFRDCPRPGRVGRPGRGWAGIHRRTGETGGESRATPVSPTLRPAVCGLHVGDCGCWSSRRLGPSLVVALRSSHQPAGPQCWPGADRGQRTEASFQTTSLLLMCWGPCTTSGFVCARTLQGTRQQGDARHAGRKGDPALRANVRGCQH